MGGTLDDFVRARIEEDVRRARGLARRSDGQEDWVAALTEALDRRELAELATTADFDERSEYADRIRRRLAANYSAHPDFREDYCA